MPEPMPLLANRVMPVTGLPVVAVMMPMGMAPPDPIMAVTELAIQVPLVWRVAFTLRIWLLLIMPMPVRVWPFMPMNCVPVPEVKLMEPPCNVPMVKVLPEVVETLPTICIMPPCSGVAVEVPEAIATDGLKVGVKVRAPPAADPTEAARLRSRFTTIALLPTVSGVVRGMLTVMGVEKTCWVGVAEVM